MIIYDSNLNSYVSAFLRLLIELHFYLSLIKGKCNNVLLSLSEYIPVKVENFIY
jgi:hypothetical protein